MKLDLRRRCMMVGFACAVLAGCAGAKRDPVPVPGTHAPAAHTNAAADDDAGVGELERDARTARLAQNISALRPLVQARCEWLFGCCNVKELDVKLGPFVEDPAQCTERVLQAAASGSSTTATSEFPFAVQVLLDLSYGPAAELVKLDQSAIARCASQLKTAACSEPTPIGHCVPEAVVEDPCDIGKLIVGLGQAGDQCVFLGYNTPLGCGPGARCARTQAPASTDNSYCIATRQMGEACAQDQECDDKLVCDYQTGRCAAGAEADVPCAFSDPAHPSAGTEAVRCAAGLACDVVTLRCTDARCHAGSSCAASCPEGMSCIENQCLPPREPGDECTTHGDCVNHLCISSQQLTVPGRCAHWAKLGESCNWDPQCESGFCDAGQRCAPTVAQGKPCPSTQDSQCTTGECQSDGNAFVCTANGAEGKSCSSNADCVSRLHFGCVAGRCRPAQLGPGDSCSVDAQCLAGACLMGQCRTQAGVGNQCGRVVGLLDCQPGTYCNNFDNPGVAGACVAVKSLGDPCAASNECWEGRCVTAFGSRRCGASPTSCVGPRKDP